MTTEEKQIGTDLSLQNYVGLSNEKEEEITPFDMGLLDGIEKYGRKLKVTFEDEKKPEMDFHKLVD